MIELALAALMVGASPASSPVPGGRPGAPESDTNSSLAARVRASVAAGSGGRVAAFAQCYLPAVIYFFDGHQTPELIPDWLVKLTQVKESGPLCRP